MAALPPRWSSSDFGIGSIETNGSVLPFALSGVTSELGLTFAWWLSGGRREIGVFPDRIGTIPDAGSGVSPMDAGTRTVIHVDERVLVLALPHLIPDANGYGCLKLANLEIVSR